MNRRQFVKIVSIFLRKFLFFYDFKSIQERYQGFLLFFG